MTTVSLNGWREGLNKVRLNHLLRQYLHLGLADAKHAVDELLEGRPLVYEFPDQASASLFGQSASELGANVEVTVSTTVENPISIRLD